MPKANIAIPTGSYVDNLNIAGSSKPGLVIAPRAEAVDRWSDSKLRNFRIPTMPERRGNFGKAMTNWG
jgi:hypothetical protein